MPDPLSDGQTTWRRLAVDMQENRRSSTRSCHWVETTRLGPILKGYQVPEVQ
jgi:hypothetical protein